MEKIKDLYIISYDNKIEAITNDFGKWLLSHNEQRIADGESAEEESEFKVRKMSIEIY